jgi:endonuclease/exonuclease/phosphatase family metal-dependent hydrolase
MAVVATYNIHSCIGVDGRMDAARIASVIDEIGPDILALQEVDASLHPAGFLDQWEWLARRLKLHCIPGISLRTHRKSFGNALFTREPPLRSCLHDISIPRREPRGAIEADLLFEGRLLRVIATHLGLRRDERRQQASMIAAKLARDTSPAATLLLADLNEWRPSPKVLGLAPLFQAGPSPRSFPARRPMLALDRILAAGPIRLEQLRAHISAAARIASDHLPLRAELRWL